MKIESLNNQKVKNWLKLKEKKYRDIENLFLVEGNHLVKEALKYGKVKEIISISPNDEVEGIPLFEVTEAIMKKLSSQTSSTNIIAVVEKLEEKEITGTVCLLDELQDPGNLGTIIRSAKAFQVDTIIMSNNSVDLYNEKVIRSSEGMIFGMNIIRTDLKEIIPKLKKMGYKIYSTDVNRGTLLNQVAFEDKKAIVIGNEGKGVKEEIHALCDDFIHIPISDACESLNAGVAASIIFYEMSI